MLPPYLNVPMGVSVTVLKVEVAGTEAVFAPSVEEETGLLSTP